MTDSSITYQTGIFDHIFNCTMWMLGENINLIIIHITIATISASFTLLTISFREPMQIKFLKLVANQQLHTVPQALPAAVHTLS